MSVNELSTKLTNDASQFNQSMDQATDKVEKFQDATDGAQKSIDDLGKKGAMSTKDLLKEMGKLSGAEKGLYNYRRQLSQMTKDISDLTINYNNMSKEMQNSDIGKAALQRIQELTAQAGKYRDAIGDAQQSIKNLASDTQWIDAFRQSVNLASGALQTFAAAGVLSADSQEELVKVIAKVKAIETSANGVLKIANALNKNSALIDGIRTIQKKALTKSIELETAATVKATIAQKALNLVAKASPYVLLATAILGVAAAVGGWMLATKKNNSVQAQAAKIQEDYNKKLREAQGEAGTTVAKFKILESQYKSLRTEGDKQQWIKDNADKFNELGMQINDVNDADDTFIKNADKVIQAMVLRAKAAAAMSVYEEKYAEAYKKSLEMQDKAAKKGGGMTGPRYWKKQGLKEGEDYVNNPITMQSSAGAFTQNNWQLTESGRKKMEAAGKEAGKAYLDGISDSMGGIVDDIAAWTSEAQKLESEVAGYRNKQKKEEKDKTPKGGGGSKKTEEENEKILSQIKLLEQAIEKKKKEVDLYEDESEEQAKVINELVEMNKQYDALVKKHNDWLVELRKQRTGQIEPISIPVKPDFEAALKNANQVTLKTDTKLEVPVTPKLEPLYLDEWLDGLVDQIDGFSGLADGIVGSFKSVYTSVSELGDALDEAEGPLEQFFTLWETGMNIVNMAATVIDAVSTLTTLLNGKMGIQIGLKKADTETTKENTRAKIKNAGADAAAAIAGGAKSAADIPIVGWILAGVAAVTLLATLMSAMSSAKGFATGGVVGGNSYTGDKILARLNSGELVLNRDQQSKLWKDLNSNVSKPDNSLENGHVEFKIKGTELVGVLKNYNSKINKI